MDENGVRDVEGLHVAAGGNVSPGRRGESSEGSLLHDK